MAADTEAVKRNIFDIMQMFGPASTGGPSYNVNPGQGVGPPQGQPTPEPPAPPPPPPQMQAPVPSGVSVLPPSTAVTPNAPAVQQALPPGMADPSLLPPELQKSQLFRYLMAQKAAQYEAAQQQANQDNFTGGLMQLIGSASGNKQAVAESMSMGGRAKSPGGLEVGELLALQKHETDTAATAKKSADLNQAAVDMAKYTGQPVEVMKAIIAANPSKIADIAENRININDDEKERLRVNKDLEANGQRAYSPMEWHTMQTQDKIAIQREQSAGGERVKLAGGEIQEARTANKTAGGTLARNAEIRRLIEQGGVVGGGYLGETYLGKEFEQPAREVAARLGITDPKPLQNEKVIFALTAKSALDLGQQMKGSFSDKDMALLTRASAGDPSLTAEERMQILGMHDLALRRQIDENNTQLERAGKRIGEDRSGERTTPSKMSAGELRAIDPDVARLMVADPAQGEQLARFRYGDSVANELKTRTDEIIEQRLYTQPPSTDPTDPGGRITKARTQPDKDAITYFRAVPAERLEANRDAVISRLEQLNPGEGKATYELMLAAKKAGGFGEAKK